MKKSERLDLIRKIVTENAIETQNDLVSLLKEEGLTATQATISRDINEIGIVKIPTDHGKYIYGLSKEKPKKVAPTINVINGSLKAISEETPGLLNFIHIDLVPGNTRLIKRVLLEQFGSDVFSCIADDDSILLVAKSQLAAKRIRESLEMWMEKG